MGSELTVRVLGSQVTTITPSPSGSFMASDDEVAEDGDSVYYAVRLPLIVVDERSGGLSVVWDVVMMNRPQIEFLKERVQIVAGYWMRLSQLMNHSVIVGRRITVMEGIGSTDLNDDSGLLDK